jgi:uncharacterized membrane protein YedE/YeeE
MSFLSFAETFGDAPTSALFGLITRIVFGIAAQRSGFCLRAATVEFARGTMGPRVSIWLLTFSTALVWVPGAEWAGLMRGDEARMMAVAGSWSGAIIGGVLFGIGMVLARGCSGRLLLMAATGNLRSVISGLIFAFVAQTSLGGWLAPMRNSIAALRVTPGGRNINLLDMLGLPRETGLAAGLVMAVFAVVMARRNKMSNTALVMASGVSFAVALGWVQTYGLA